jgi:hypothetical protein
MKFPPLTYSKGLKISDRKMFRRTTDDGFRLPFLGFVEINNWGVAGCPISCNSFVSAKILEHRVRGMTASRHKSISREENAMT